MSNFTDLDLHNDLMKELNKASDKSTTLHHSAEQAIEDLDIHNNAPDSHPDLRRMVEQAGDVTDSTLLERISQHNTDSTAHSERFAELEAKMNDTATIVQNIDRRINDHNVHESAHPDIRESINNIKAQLGDTTMADVSHDIESIQGILNGEIANKIYALQDTDARHDSLINKNIKDIADLAVATENASDEIYTIGNHVFKNEEALDKLKIDTLCLDMNEKYGYDQELEEHPNLREFIDTLPIYMGSDTVTSFKFGGTKDSTGGEDITYEIINDNPLVQFAPTENIDKDTTVTATVPTTTNYGEIVTFFVKIKDNTNNNVITRTLGFMIAKPLDVGLVSCSGLPKNVEPGLQYKFKIKNIFDDGKRFSYNFDALATNLIFSKYNGVRAGEEITVTIPVGAPRDADLIFNILIKDIYCVDQTKPITVHTNPLPGAEDFVHNVPAEVRPNADFMVKFSGIKSPDGVDATYSIENFNEFLTFSKTENLLANENVNIHVSRDAVRGETYTFVVISTDENGNQVRIELGFRINMLPSASTITTTLPESAKGGDMISMFIRGGEDRDMLLANGDDVYYIIDSDGSGLRFSGLTNLREDTEITVTVPYVAQDVTKTFNIYAVDKLGERSETPKVISLLVKPKYMINAPAILTPQEGATVKPEFTIQLTECDVYAYVMRANDALE